MKIGVIGLGSMGKRRIRLLQQIDSQYDLTGIDTRADRRIEAEETFGIKTTDSLKKAVAENQIEALVVSTSPLSHAKIIHEALSCGCHVFTELNLVNDLYEENMQLAEEKGLVLFLSSTMMFREETAYIAEEVRKSAHPVNYIYHIGQFLPTWHIWESYKDFFVGDRRTNGCREVFAIELPWLTDVFGPVEDFQVVKGRMTDLEIDYPDHYELLIRHKNGSVGSLNVNVVSQYAVRNLEIYGQSCYIRWEGTPDSLRKYDPEAGKMECIQLYSQTESINEQNRSIIEDAYRKELEEFTGVIGGTAEYRYSFAKDQEVLRLIDRIEGDFKS